MKSLLVALIISVASLSVFAEAEVKKVCHDKTDAKGNVVKKADGSAAPPATRRGNRASPPPM